MLRRITSVQQSLCQDFHLQYQPRHFQQFRHSTVSTAPRSDPSCRKSHSSGEKKRRWVRRRRRWLLSMEMPYQAKRRKSNHAALPSQRRMPLLPWMSPRFPETLHWMKRTQTTLFLKHKSRPSSSDNRKCRSKRDRRVARVGTWLLNP